MEFYAAEIYRPGLSSKQFHLLFFHLLDERSGLLFYCCYRHTSNIFCLQKCALNFHWLTGASASSPAGNTRCCWPPPSRGRRGTAGITPTSPTAWPTFTHTGASRTVSSPLSTSARSRPDADPKSGKGRGGEYPADRLSKPVGI